ncbi:MAG: MFS transporter [Burkholderiales bacterium]|nr:MFS transporter [Burkholderiales bacterium]
MSNPSSSYSKHQYLHKAFIVLLICSLFLFYKYIAQLFPSTISEDLINNYHFNGLELAIMASSYYYSYSVLQLAAGYLIDRHDVRIPCFLAILTLSIAMLIFSYTNNFYIMCISRVFMGAGASFATVLYMKCAAVWASKKAFGILSSLLATVTMFGAAFGNAPIAIFFKTTGWHNGLFIIAIGGLIIAAMALIFVSNRGAIGNLNEFKLNLKDIYIIMRNKLNWLLFAYAGITFAPLLILGGLWGNPFLIEKFHITNTSASMLLSIMFIGIGIGSPVWAILAALLNQRKNLMHLANLIAFLDLIGIIYLDFSYSITLILFFILGFAVGCFMLCFQFCREINSIYIMGIAVAFVNMGDGIISSIIEPLIGCILDLLKTGNIFSLNSYKLAFSILPLCYIISSITILPLATKHMKQ